MKTYASHSTRFDYPIPRQDTFLAGLQGHSERPPGYGLDFADSQLQPIHRTAAIGRLPRVQAKLTVYAAGDKYEQEADRVAEQVMRMRTPVASVAQYQDEEEQLQTQPLAASITPLAQRTAVLEEEELQAKFMTAGGAFAPGAAFESRLAAARGGGARLPEATRGFMEQRIGADFSDVRVHTDLQSDQLNRSIQAKAFTTGQDIFFRRGAYQPTSPSGQALLAHELTHVVQQNGGAVEVSHTPTNPLSRHTATRTPSETAQGLMRTAKREPMNKLAPAVQREIFYEGITYREKEEFERIRAENNIPEATDLQISSPSRFVLNVNRDGWELDPEIQFKRYKAQNKVGERTTGASRIHDFADVGYAGQEPDTRTGPKHPAGKMVSQISIWGTSGMNQRNNHWWLFCDVIGGKGTKYLKVDLTSEAYRIMYGAGRPNADNKEWATIPLPQPVNIDLVYRAFVEIAKTKGRWKGGVRYNCQDFALEMLRMLGLANTEGYGTMAGLRAANKV